MVVMVDREEGLVEAADLAVIAQLFVAIVMHQLHPGEVQVQVEVEAEVDV